MDKEKIYQRLYGLFCAAYPVKSRKELQVRCAEYWREIRKKEDFMNLYSAKEQELTDLVTESRNKNQRFFKQFPTTKPRVSLNQTNNDTRSDGAEPVLNDSEQAPIVLSISTPTSNTEKSAKAADCEPGPSGVTPKQDTVKNELAIVNADIANLLLRQDKGMITVDQVLELKKLKKSKDRLEKKLKKLIDGQQRQQTFRDNLKRKKQKLSEPSPAKASKLNSCPGRPRKDDEAEIMDAIIDIAQYGSSAQERRRFEQLRTVKTLDDLVERLKELGYNMSRTYVYYRLMPKRSITIEGKRHVNTVPVRLIRATNDHHKFHQDTRFCASTIKRLDEVASFLGPHEVARISQDDKARVPLAITAASHQSPILMHMEYRVRLPDHDWVIAEKHKLIPSVYAGK
ncbi:uncharacterized protein LOC134204280 [Armigeres subalbatus]|uniref:uncharacterized protein LOC134204280 n=1 Tax=Armigeres subalbatus TaxID=124917 RepID=UPI002ED690A7